MKINIYQMIEGAKSARGLTVIIDVFRAFTVEAYLLEKGALGVIPIGDEKEAYRLKEENPDMLLAGERHGAILPGFDIGNSPAQVLETEVLGKTVIHTTSAGTQGIANATGADEILGGSLVNAKATAEYIKKSGAKEVSLVCMGLEAISETEEDTLCARYIKSLILGEELDIEKEVADLKNTSGAKFFDLAQQSVFPEPDFWLSTKVDEFNFVMRLENGIMKKINEV